ncbi:DnaJ-like protein subfamily B member 4 [Nematocida major]|uniref:DnaJ-like protein subfamily B member 4 n=1 Tax=Nematocida major TaxID=1912982 RepID=UPI002008BF3A|nr:DnaJ-like protein subfamily B member 4 [Nematocida major]KAH9385857.1 DnaJ-like protein subfamily B member 4 [Nematocida major]
MPKKQTLYEVLGVSKGATDSEIRSAYKKLARKYHPDMHTGKSEAEKKQMQDKFKELNSAYEVLTDKDQRASYDLTGMTQEEMGNQRARSSHGYAGFSDFFSGFSFSGSNAYDSAEFGAGHSFFSEMHGSDGIFGGSREKSPENGIFEYMLAVSLEEICTGSIRNLRIKRTSISMARETVELSVNIQPGYKYGTKITYKNAGDYDRFGRGTDVVVILTEKPHPLFKRAESDIVYEFDLSIKQYLRGFARTVPGLWGNHIKITDSMIGNNGGDILVEGEGIPDRRNGMKRGKLIIRPRIIMDLTQKERARMAESIS